MRRKVLDLLCWLGIFLCGCFLAAALAYPALAEWKPEYANSSVEVQSWYKAQEINPEARARLNVAWKSCCDHSDVVRTRFRINRTTAADEWWYLDENTWRLVPADIIHWNDPTPDGQPVLFVYSGRPTCFYPGESGG